MDSCNCNNADFVGSDREVCGTIIMFNAKSANPSSVTQSRYLDELYILREKPSLKN